MKSRFKSSLLAAAATGCIIVLAGLCAPYLYAEYELDMRGSVRSAMPMPTESVVGRWIEDYFVVERLDAGTFAIGEPRYYQGNYSYLILGSQRAILFDAGTGLRDIVPVVRQLTGLPVTVIASHLHFDHVGALGKLDRTAAVDVPSLRDRVRHSRLSLERYEFLGFADRLDEPTFEIDDWWADESVVDLGDRQLRVMLTPGHTETSISLYDETRHQLFVGDFIYPGELYAFLPGASRSAYLKTTKHLLSVINPVTHIYAAHMADSPAAVQAPVLDVADLRALQATLETIDTGNLKSRGFYPRIFPVKGSITFGTGLPWNTR